MVQRTQDRGAPVETRRAVARCGSWSNLASRDAGCGMRDALKDIDKLPRDPVLITAFLAKDPASLLTRLKCSSRDIERGRAIAQWRDRYPEARDQTAVRRWLSQTGDA